MAFSNRYLRRIARELAASRPARASSQLADAYAMNASRFNSLAQAQATQGIAQYWPPDR